MLSVGIGAANAQETNQGEGAHLLGVHRFLLRIGTGFQWFQALRIRNKAIDRGALKKKSGFSLLA